MSINITPQENDLAMMAGMNQPVNQNRQKMRVEDVDFRIACHEHSIKTLLDLASSCKECKCSRQRAKIAQEIGYSRIEIECFLKPLRERLLSDAPN
jgi:hypothetical protein